MFQFSGLTLPFRSNTPSVCWVVPFGNLRIYHSCAVPRSLSQLTTSFIVSQTLGIHHAPLFALKNFSEYVLHITYPTILVFDFAIPICQRANRYSQTYICSYPSQMVRIRSFWLPCGTNILFERTFLKSGG